MGVYVLQQQSMNVQECEQSPISNADTSHPSQNGTTQHQRKQEKESVGRGLCWAVMGMMIVMATIAYLHQSSYLCFCYYQQAQFQIQLLLPSVHTTLPDINTGGTMQQTIQQLSTQTSTSTSASSSSSSRSKYKATKQAYFAYSLYNNIYHPSYPPIEKYYFQSKYNISHYATKQLSLCVVSTGRNTLFRRRYRSYLDSIARQEYTNYRVVVVDDHSDDGSVQAVQAYLNNPHMDVLRSRLTLIANEQRKYALFNKDNAITNYCSANDIIVELDSDDELIGTQVFATINAIYSANASIWAMYSSYIYWHPDCGCPTEGISAPVPAKVLQQGTYRSTTQYYTSATKTYKRQLYDKIDKKDFVDQHGQYHRWTSDLFVHYSLVELAGIDHYHFVHEVFYYYYLDHNTFNRVEKAISRLDALAIRPYKKLNSLKDPPERVEGVSNLEWIKEKKQEWEGCISSRNQDNCDLNI